ncbi:HET-domain-containing protein [Annulohypoxylon maeteangense]|uniref:HET-domain-containing protein n=1 Tax=Annulohypoxylon maeteangense TaxID=1927788 RepID=UPI00200772A2|nr:HET-domain-containing protein [Annulohypoxylon maeteangense]KAI0886180.1 HET-domain-containing protein [Annulohypoxylon maeteangense]
MYLLDVETITLHQFYGNAIPKRKYAILSHTWGEDEVSFQDLQAGNGPSKMGYLKILYTCEQAKEDGLEWAWVDTCCIDKSSSAELSESINSMYQWYKDSAICYAYLVDVDKFPHTRSIGDENPQVSRWFTRAWTLQELIAPQELRFYGPNWSYIGLLEEEEISRVVSAVTRIPSSLTQGYMSLSGYSTAQKMSWAAHRRSTRDEDIAYSLLGLFNVSMPLLYGEGPKAFIRLQEEILKETDDHTLLCWTVPEMSPRAWTLQSVFASSPDDFSEAGEVKESVFDSGHPSAITNRGLQIYLPLTEQLYGEGSHLYHRNLECEIFNARLNVLDVRSPLSGQMSIQLVKSPPMLTSHLPLVNRYARLATPSLKPIKRIFWDIKSPADGRPQLIYIHKNLPIEEQGRFGIGGVHLQNIPITKGLYPFPAGFAAGRAEDNLRNFRIKTVRYPGLQREACDLDSLITLRDMAMEDGIMWSTTYGCATFNTELRQIPKRPYFIIFGMEYLRDVDQSFSLLLAWDNAHIHFNLCRSEAQISESLLSKYFLGKPRWRWRAVDEVDEVDEVDGVDGVEEKSSWAEIIDPSHRSTLEGNCWDMYGRIASTRVSIGNQIIEFTLDREDPNSKDGEAASNRLHFLIRATEHQREETT